MFELGLLHELVAGRHDPLQIGEVPQRICRHFSCGLPFVYLSTYTVKKILKKHGDVTFFDLLILPLLLKHGTYIADRNSCMAIGYQHPETNKDYLAAIKMAKGNLEFWLSTFHRVDAKQLAGVYRRGPRL